MKTSTHSDYLTRIDNTNVETISMLMDPAIWDKLTVDLNGNRLVCPSIAKRILSKLMDFMASNPDNCWFKGSHLNDEMEDPPVYVTVPIDYFYKELADLSPETIDQYFEYLYDAMMVTYIHKHTVYFWSSQLLKLVDHN